jgi:hypothetical protein
VRACVLTHRMDAKLSFSNATNEIARSRLRTASDLNGIDV